MTVYVITLEPEKKLSDKIKKLKKEAKSLVGNQLYLEDSPHMTIYISDFKDMRYYDDELNNMVQNLKSFDLEVLGWLNFLNDEVTGKNAMTLEFKQSKELLDIQKKIIDFFNKRRKNGIITRYSNVYDNINIYFKQNIDLYGYPFVGKIWKPHISIASFDKKSFDKVWEKFSKLNLKGNYKAEFLCIYELEESTERLKRIKKISLIQ